MKGTVISALQEYKRTDRIGDQIKMEVADILLKKTKDPRIGFVTVTSVEVSDDLRHAKIFVSVHQDPQKAFAGLKKATRFVRGELAKRLQIRRMPDLVFLPDESTEKVSHLLDLLEEIGKEGSPKDRTEK
ncbi:MAG TPA: 30S ribosome-binding factor RbfA [Candidatus Manganitrophaceae bacterium]|nr:30S ribosome-binding factor RbfA [Candidatus Manganitrophaceae bacterium]